MNIIQFILRAILGGLLIAIIPELAKHGSPKLAGIILTIPIMSILGLYFAGHDSGIRTSSQIAHAALFGLIPLALFFVAVIILNAKIPLCMMLASSFALWLTSAFILHTIIAR